MGVAIKDILSYEEIDISKLSNKKVAIDSFNMLFQFLASIRQADGSQLTDSKGNVTSHLKGLFNRCVYFKKNNVKAVFVFDGEAPKLKEREREIRAQKKIEADKKYREALELGLTEDAKKYAQALNKLDEKMILDAKHLISLFGFPIIQAPSEGEAQGSYLVDKGQLYAVASQDFDSLLFGAKILVRNISVSSRRKVAGTSTYKSVPIEFYDLNSILKELKISHEELIIVAIMCGTDFNPGGIKGIGPKKALKLVKEYRDRWDDLFKNLDWFSSFPYPWQDVYNTFRKIPVNEVKEINFSEIKKDEIVSFLESVDFDPEMTKRSLSTIQNIKTLDKFF